jgi:drug/metabolite transporter (DMT)-like permease
MFLPLDASPHTWGWLLTSGLVGFVLGDLCLFRAFVLIGPRLTMLIGAIAPPIAAIFGFVLLNERISLLGIAGMVVTIAGILWVVSESPDAKPAENAPTKKEDLRNGLLLAVGGAAGQGIGMVLSKVGMAGDYDAFASGQIRIIAGIVGFSILFTAVGWWKKTANAIRDSSAMGFATLGSFVGPFIGVSLSLLAVKNTETGISVTLMSITPVLLIPAVILIHKERVSARAILGTIVTVAGVALLVMR